MTGARPGIDGDYKIDGVTHTLKRGGGFTTSLELKKPSGSAEKTAARLPAGDVESLVNKPYDLRIWKGNTFRMAFDVLTRTRLPFVLTGSEVVFRAVAGDVVLLRKTLTVTGGSGSRIEMVLTPAETRLLPQGRTARYEIERRTGQEQRTLLFGHLVVSEWANDDV